MISKPKYQPNYEILSTTFLSPVNHRQYLSLMRKSQSSNLCLTEILDFVSKNLNLGALMLHYKTCFVISFKLLQNKQNLLSCARFSTYLMYCFCCFLIQDLFHQLDVKQHKYITEEQFSQGQQCFIRYGIKDIDFDQLFFDIQIDHMITFEHLCRYLITNYYTDSIIESVHQMQAHTVRSGQIELYNELSQQERTCLQGQVLNAKQQFSQLNASDQSQKMVKAENSSFLLSQPINVTLLHSRLITDQETANRHYDLIPKSFGQHVGYGQFFDYLLYKVGFRELFQSQLSVFEPIIVLVFRRFGGISGHLQKDDFRKCLASIQIFCDAYYQVLNRNKQFDGQISFDDAILFLQVVQSYQIVNLLIGRNQFLNIAYESGDYVNQQMFFQILLNKIDFQFHDCSLDSVLQTDNQLQQSQTSENQLYKQSYQSDQLLKSMEISTTNTNIDNDFFLHNYEELQFLLESNEQAIKTQFLDIVIVGHYSCNFEFSKYLSCIKNYIDADFLSTQVYDQILIEYQKIYKLNRNVPQSQVSQLNYFYYIYLSAAKYILTQKYTTVLVDSLFLQLKQRFKLRNPTYKYDQKSDISVRSPVILVLVETFAMMRNIVIEKPKMVKREKSAHIKLTRTQDRKTQLYGQFQKEKRQFAWGLTPKQEYILATETDEMV